LNNESAMPTDDDPDASMTDEQRLAWFAARAEAAYNKMYDASNSTDAAARYSDARRRCTTRSVWRGMAPRPNRGRDPAGGEA
jgi:hypothetical protein